MKGHYGTNNKRVVNPLKINAKERAAICSLRKECGFACHGCIYYKVCKENDFFTRYMYAKGCGADGRSKHE